MIVLHFFLVLGQIEREGNFIVRSSDSPVPQSISSEVAGLPEIPHALLSPLLRACRINAESLSTHKGFLDAVVSILERTAEIRTNSRCGASSRATDATTKRTASSFRGSAEPFLSYYWSLTVIFAFGGAPTPGTRARPPSSRILEYRKSRRPVKYTSSGNR
jgi:hypothetical protein